MEVLVEHKTVHHIDHFNQHYTEALVEAEAWAMISINLATSLMCFGLPSPQGYCLCGFIFKNDADGDTFVISPVALPFLHTTETSE